jgi:hypothetical protein
MIINDLYNNKKQVVAEGSIATVGWPDEGNHTGNNPTVSIGGTVPARPVVKQGSLVKASGLTGVYRVMDIRGDEAKIVQEIPNTGQSTYVPMSDLRVWTNKPIKEQGMAEGADTSWIPDVVKLLGKLVASSKAQAKYNVEPADIPDVKEFINSLSAGNLDAARYQWEMMEWNDLDNALEYFVRKNGLPHVWLHKLLGQQDVAEGSRTPQDWEVKSAVWGLDKRGVHQEPQDVKSHFVRADRSSRAEKKAKREYEPGRQTWEIHPRGNKQQGVAEASLGDYRKKAALSKATSQMDKFFGRDDPAAVSAADQTIAKREKGLARADARVKPYTPPAAAPVDLEKRQRDLTAKYPNIDELVRRAELNRDPNYERADGQAYYAARDAEQNYQKLKQIQRVIQGLNESLNRSHLP